MTAQASPAGIFDIAWSGIAIALACVVAGAVIGAGTPETIPLTFLQEDGPVENATIVLYFAALLCVVYFHPRPLTATDIAALLVVLVALAAREADLHIALFGISILKSRFYTRHAQAGQIVVALAILAPIIASAGWLVWRYLRRWLGALARFRATAVTVLVFGVALVVAKTTDRIPAILIDAGLAPSPALVNMLLGAEETLEMGLPILVIMATVQAWIGLETREAGEPEAALPAAHAASAHFDEGTPYR